MPPKAVSPVTKKRANYLRRLGEAREAEREETQKQARKKLEDRRLVRVKSGAKATLRTMKRRAEQEFVKAGGDPEKFEEVWNSGLKEKLLIERVSKFVNLPQPSLARNF